MVGGYRDQAGAVEAPVLVPMSEAERSAAIVAFTDSLLQGGQGNRLAHRAREAAVRMRRTDLLAMRVCDCAGL
jgi:hypothetical protein